MTSFHEDNDLVSHDHPQIYELNDTFVEYLVEDIYENEPLIHDKF